MTTENEADLIRKAEALLSKGNANRAEELLNSAQGKFPDSQSIKASLADTYRVLLRFDDAIAIYTDLLEKDAKYSAAANNLARILIHLGQFKAATDVWQNAITANNDDTKLLKRAASMFAHFGQKTIAEKFLVRANEQVPDEVTTKFMLTALRGINAPDRVPGEFVQQHFDSAAESYDEHLQEIGNAGPDKIGELLTRLALPMNAGLIILDAGCGTGLCGPILKPFAKQLHGVDLSPAMLELASQRDTYGELLCVDLVEYLGTTDNQYDLIIAADVLTYFGLLDEVMSLFFQRMKPGGHLIFSVEAVPENVYSSKGYLLSPSGRFKHMKDGVADALNMAGFSSPEIAEPFVLRHEYGEPVNGMAIVTRRPSN